jgi:hypothetical protein
LPSSDTDVFAGIADIDVAVADHQTDRTETGRRFQGLLDLGRRHVEENQVAPVLDDERTALVEQGEIDGAAGEGDLLAGRFEDLVGRHDDAAVGLDADLELVALVGSERRGH